PMYFKPKELVLKAGTPYVIELVNVGKVLHEYTADRFFPTVAFRKASQAAGAAPDTDQGGDLQNCLQAQGPPEVRDGREDQGHRVAGGPGSGSDGLSKVVLVQTERALSRCEFSQRA